MEKADEADGQVSQRGHDLRAVSSAQLVVLLVKDHVTDPVKPVLDFPVPTNPGPDDLGLGLVHPLGGLDGLEGVSHHPPPVRDVNARDGRNALPRQILQTTVQGLLVALDSEHVVTTLIADPLGGACSVGGDHRPRPGPTARATP